MHFPGAPFCIPRCPPGNQLVPSRGTGEMNFPNDFAGRVGFPRGTILEILVTCIPIEAAPAARADVARGGRPSFPRAGAKPGRAWRARP